MQEGDPRFVYKLILRKTDFNRIKKDQELDTDFDAFPGEIIDFMQSSDSNICVKGFFNSDKSKFRFAFHSPFSSFYYFTKVLRY